MSRIVDILVRRDGITEDEARIQLRQVREMVHDAIEAGQFEEAEDIVMSELGLEMDYIDEIIL